MLSGVLLGVIGANDFCLECGDARGDTLPTIEDRVIRLHAMPKLLASMEKTPCMNEDDHIKQLLRFTSEDELIRLAEIGLAVEMHQAAHRFFRGGTDVPYTEETAAKLKAYLEPQSRRLMLARGHGYPAAKRHLLVISKGTCSF